MPFLKEIWPILIFPAACIIAVAIFWPKLVALVQGSGLLRKALAGTEVLFATLLSVVASIFEVWKKQSFDKPTPEWRFGLSLCLALVVLYFVLKMVAHTVKEKDQAEIARLKQEIQSEQLKSKVVQQQRDNSVYTVSLLREIVEVKLERLTDLNSSSEPISFDALFDKALAPEVQIRFIIASIHKYFQRHLPPDGVLTLHLFMLDRSDSNQLVAVHSWDGKSDRCFPEEYLQYMKLIDPKGAPSVVARCYNSPRKLLLIPSCVEAERKRDFSFFHASQKDFVCSMLLFKHVFESRGKEDAFVISMDTNIDGFFKSEAERG